MRVRLLVHNGLSSSQLLKSLPAIQETWVQSLGWEGPLEKGKATHSSILAWRVPWGIVHGVAKSRTRLSDFHFYLLCHHMVRRGEKAESLL